MQPLRMVFCGTPQFAVPSFHQLLQVPEFEIVAVLTQPDRPRGRGQEITFAPVKEAALDAKLPLHQPAKVRAPEVEEQLRALRPDVIVIIAFGQIIPARLLAVPKHGWINLHASLLPKYRGAAPINWAIVNGETTTGISTMRIDAGMDTGEILLQQALTIGADETAPELIERLANAGGPLMVETLRGIASGRLSGQPQNNDEATLAPILKREDGWIDWSLPAAQIYNRMRGFSPWPGTYTRFRGQTCHLQGVPVSDGSAHAEPGTILRSGEKIRVVCGQGSLLELKTVKLEGRRQISAAEFVNGARLQAGERFAER
ncbi:MAG: methionyl-tRNA formyltransferase [Candidatus Acidiferrum sp.]